MTKKKILVAYYSQSGQLKNILDRFISPFEDEVNYEIFFHQIKPQIDYPFPWTSETFFDTFPESVLEEGCELKEFPPHLIQKYDMIILGLQVWYLSPSIPITAFLKSSAFKQIAKDTPLITVNACRNMWFMAHRSIRTYIEEAKANYTGHLVLFDKVNNLISVITIMYWAFTGKKDQKWGVFPKPGVSDADIENTALYGQLLLENWKNDKLDKLQEVFVENKGVEVIPHLMSMEHKAKRIFKIWTKIVRKKGGAGNPKRKIRLIAFKYYLLFMIFIISPIATLIFYLTYPLFYKRIRKSIRFFQSV